ncbi:MAG: hypothetical protein G8345_10555 [Magnetococcales bacterium]|nr:hypothetical protein [Magnetococcales bacterium]NGZ27313.1 hypothetical protein [Magnetococcales bacterium]
MIIPREWNGWIIREWQKIHGYHPSLKESVPQRPSSVAFIGRTIRPFDRVVACCHAGVEMALLGFFWCSAGEVRDDPLGIDMAIRHL